MGRQSFPRGGSVPARHGAARRLGLGAEPCSGRVAGTVLDASGGVLPGATVTLTNVPDQPGGDDRHHGHRRIHVPAGCGRHLQGRRRAAGLQDGDLHQVIVNVGQEYSLTAKLELGQLSETVEVTAGGVAGQDDDAGGQHDGRSRRRCWRCRFAGRDVTQPHQAAGRRAWDHAAQQDGHRRRASDVDAGHAGRDQRPGQLHPDQLPRLPAEPADARTTSPSSASRRRSRGRIRPAARRSVRMVTPSGTNAFRGSVFEANRNSDLSANSFFNNKSGVAEAVPEPEPVRRPAGRADQEEQAVLLRVLRGIPPGQHDGAEQHDPGARRLGHAGVFRYAALDGSVQSDQRPAAGGRDARPEDPVDRPREHAEGVVGQQLRYAATRDRIGF